MKKYISYFALLEILSRLQCAKCLFTFDTDSKNKDGIIFAIFQDANSDSQLIRYD